MPQWANGSQITYVPGLEWVNHSSTVTGLSGTTITFKHNNNGNWDIPSNDDSFFLFGKLEALDADSELFTNDTTHELYLYSTTNPSTKNLEIKDINNGYWSVNQSNLRFENLHFEGIAKTVTTGSNNVTFDHTTHELGNYTYQYNDANPELWGYADNLTVNNSVFKNSSYYGLTPLGSGTFNNNVFFDTGYNHGGYEATLGTQVILNNNTSLNSISHGLQLAGAGAGSIISNNYVAGYGTITSDIGGISRLSGSLKNDAGGLRVTKNFITNSKSKSGYAGNIGGFGDEYYQGAKGVYFDSGFNGGSNYNYIIDHNVVSNLTSDDSIHIWGLNPTDEGYLNERIKVYNNTMDGHIFAIAGSRKFNNTEIKNNIATTIQSNDNPGSNYFIPNGITTNNNLLMGTENQYITTTLNNTQDSRINSNNILTNINPTIDQKNNNPKLQYASQAINQGTTISGITNNVTDSNPDIGAIEFGQDAPFYGAVLRDSDLLSLNLSCDYQLNQTACTISNLPQGRIIPANFVLNLSDGINSTLCKPIYDNINYNHTAICYFQEYLPSSTQTMRASNDGINFVNMSTNLAPAPTPAISNVTNTNNTYTLSGANFNGDKNQYWQFNQDTLKSGANRYSLNTQTLIAGGLMKSNCSDIQIQSNNQSLPVWVQNCNSTNTVIHFQVSDLNNIYLLLFGNLSSNFVNTNPANVYPTVYGNNNIFWVDADSGITANGGGEVNSWADTRNNKQLIQNNSAFGGYNFKPILNTSEGSGNNYLDFTYDYMSIAGLKSASAPITQYIVAKDTVAADGEHYQKLISTRANSSPDDNGHNNVIRKSDQNGVPLPYNKQVLSNQTTTSLDNLTVGARVDNNPAWIANGLSSKVYGLMIFDIGLSTIQDDEVQDYLQFTNNLKRANASATLVFNPVNVTVNTNNNCAISIVSTSSINCSISTNLNNSTAQISNNLGLIGNYNITNPPNPTILNLKTYLNGPYNPSLNQMNTTLKTRNLIPVSHPFGPTYLGNETASAIGSNIVDWILVQLKDAGGSIITQRAGLLKNDGSIVDATNQTAGLSFNNLSAGDYTVIVRHRNHLAISTDNRISLQAGTSNSFDFSTNVNIAGSNQTNLGSGKFALKSGNSNSNNVINSVDRTLLRTTGDFNGIYSNLDLNLDGNITANDRAIVRTSPDASEVIR
jgi:hypothetical protein